MDTPAVPVVLTGAGLYLCWFSVHYWRSDLKWPTDPIKSVLQGNGVPAGGAVTAEAVLYAQNGGGSNTAGVTVGGGQNAQIAQDALRYVGASYVWGGDASAVGKWDCSSFVSYVLGHDLGLPLPGGKWGGPGMPPATHGPTTVSYLLYGAPIDRKQVGAGDLVVWQTHIGIATDNANIVAARDTAEGTGMSTIDGVSSSLGEIPSFRRVNTGGVIST